jgi:hypothetical protein
MVLKITTAIAAENLLVRLESFLPEDAPGEIAGEIEAIGRNLVFPTSGNPDQVEQEIRDLRMKPQPGASLFTPVPETLGPSEDPEAFERSAGASVRVTNAPNIDSELEIAVSTNGQNIVIGSNANYHFSTNGGGTFNPSAGISGNDPSLAFGPFVGPGVPNGTFYAANISIPPAMPGMPPPPGSTAISVSTNNGATFTFQRNAYTCGQGGDPACRDGFPDQEHIAADRSNTAPGGDQVYSVWRVVSK